MGLVLLKVGRGRDNLVTRAPLVHVPANPETVLHDGYRPPTGTDAALVSEDGELGLGYLRHVLHEKGYPTRTPF